MAKIHKQFGTHTLSTSETMWPRQAEQANEWTVSKHIIEKCFVFIIPIPIPKVRALEQHNDNDQRKNKRKNKN